MPFPLLLAFLPPFQAPAPEAVLTVQKVSDRHGLLPTPLRNRDQFGRSMSALGDLDLDGVVDLATAAHGDDDGGLDRGAVHVLFLRRDGTVKAAQKISALDGGFTGVLHDGDQLGRGLAGLGDLDGDGIPDLAVGANFDDDGGPDRGAVWILFLARDGRVRSQAKLSSLVGGLTGLRDRDEFGRALAAPGDLDGDGVPDLVVGAPYDDTGGGNKGALHVLLLTPAGTVKAQTKISARDGGFRGTLRSNDLFGFSLAAPGDLDGDGRADLVAGAVGDDDGGTNAGAAWVLYLDAARQVRAQQKISRLAGGFTGLLEAGDQFGDALGCAGDLDGDGRAEIAVGAVKDDDGGVERGACWILHLNADGTVARYTKVSATSGAFPPTLLRNFDWFGSSVNTLGDLNGDGTPDLAIGSRMDDDLGANRGALYVTFLTPTPLALVREGPAARGFPAGLALVAGVPAPGAHLLLATGQRPCSGARALLLLGLAGEEPRVLPCSEAGSDREPRLELVLPETPGLRGAALELHLGWLAPDGSYAGTSEALALQL